jgi:hypothetical protein
MAPEVGLGLDKPLLFNDFHSDKLTNLELIGKKIFTNLVPS